MTPAQILAIVALLSAFNVPQSTIDEVERIMRTPAPIVEVSASITVEPQVQVPAGWCTLTSTTTKRDVNNVPLEVRLSWEYSPGLSQAKMQTSKDVGSVYNETDEEALSRLTFITDPVTTKFIAQGATSTIKTAYQAYRLSFADGTSCTTVNRR